MVVLEETEMLFLELFPSSDFFFGVGHMPERLPSILLVAIAYPLDKIVDLTIDLLLVNDFLYFEFRAESLVKH